MEIRDELNWITEYEGMCGEIIPCHIHKSSLRLPFLIEDVKARRYFMIAQDILFVASRSSFIFQYHIVGMSTYLKYFGFGENKTSASGEFRSLVNHLYVLCLRDGIRRKTCTSLKIVPSSLEGDCA